MPQLALHFPRASDLLCKSLLTRYHVRCGLGALVSESDKRRKDSENNVKNFNNVELKVNYFKITAVKFGGFKGGVYGLCL